MLDVDPNFLVCRWSLFMSGGREKLRGGGACADMLAA